MNSLYKIYELGQSIWYDNISRDALKNGEMKKLAESGIVGVTSNPTIFEKAILGSKLYDESIKKCIGKKLNASEIIEELMIEDIQEACDIFSSVYILTKGKDGYVSIEVEPTLAKDTQGTIEAAKRLWNKVNRKNLMIKIPATIEGLNAIEEVIYSGINVNVTLIFSIERYFEVTQSYIRGLKRRINEGKNISHIHSVASVFVSRIDTLIDGWLKEKIEAGQVDLTDYLGKSAVYNTKLLYRRFKDVFYGHGFDELEQLYKANFQRPLWASTSTKNPNYPQTIYVDDLVAEDSVNTLPPATIGFVLKNEYSKAKIEEDIDKAMNGIYEMGNKGIDFSEAFRKLEEDGVASFYKSFETLRDAINQKIEKLK